MKTISVITVIKNRIRNFRIMLEQLNKAVVNEHIDFTVVDYRSDDANMQEEVAVFKNASQVITLEPPFRRSAGLNNGFKESSGDIVFFLDTDIVVPRNIFTIIRNQTKSGQAYFPKGRMIEKFDFKAPLESQVSNEDIFRKDIEAGGYWRGWGICSFTREDFIRVGMWDESFVKYGNEDKELFNRMERFKMKRIRKKEPLMYHLPHPTNIKWKNRFF